VGQCDYLDKVAVVGETCIPAKQHASADLQETCLLCGYTCMQGMRLVTVKLQKVAEFNKKCLECVNMDVNDF